MKLPQFLKAVDDYTANMNPEELKKFIHEIARTMPEGRREYCLSILQNAADTGYDDSISENCSTSLFPVDDGRAEIIESIRNSILKLDAIENGEKCLDSEYNVEWDDWYDSDEDEILFYDHADLLKDIEDAVYLVHKCIDLNIIDEGTKLCEKLCSIEIPVAGDYYDCYGDPMDIGELDRHNLFVGDFDDFAKECLYLVYMGNKLSDRSEKIFRLFQIDRFYHICLEDILQMGDHELPEFDEFLKLWIEYLGDKQNMRTDKLMLEAQSMLQDDFALLENARKYVDKHPELYLRILESKADSWEDSKTLDVGLEAIDLIPIDKVIRSEISIMTASYADRLCRFDVRNRCWLEAFRSETNIINYMRIKFLSFDSTEYEREISSIIEERYLDSKKKSNYYSHSYESAWTYGERKNILSTQDYCTMMFFEREFGKMESEGMKTGKALGWMLTFMKEGIALMLLLLHQGDSYSAGMRQMLEHAIHTCCFTKEALYKGTGKRSDCSDEDVFVELFEKWKLFTDMADNDVTSWIQKIEDLIKIRTIEIMKADKRNYYGECASFIAALGEVKESRGDFGAADELLNYYSNEYPRRRKFQAELRKYGFKS